jgi:hypothetical protein
MDYDHFNPIDILPLLTEEEQYVRDLAKTTSGNDGHYALAGAIARLVSDGIEWRKRFVDRAELSLKERNSSEQEAA